MNKKEFRTITNGLLRDLPNLGVQGQMLFIHPIGQILRGVYLEDSAANARSFFVWVFFLPLYVPTQRLSFNLGKRLRGPETERWNADSPTVVAELNAAIRKEALPFVSGIESPLDVVKVAMSLQKGADPYVQQAIAYSFARVGDVAAATAALNTLIQLLDFNIPWHREMADRANILVTELSANPSVALQRLERWEAESIANLRMKAGVAK